MDAKEKKYIIVATANNTYMINHKINFLVSAKPWFVYNPTGSWWIIYTNYNDDCAVSFSEAEWVIKHDKNLDVMHNSPDYNISIQKL